VRSKEERYSEKDLEECRLQAAVNLRYLSIVILLVTRDS
jgi:hypothetical protein